MKLFLTIFLLKLVFSFTLKQVGCDWKLNSNAANDNCGVCNGNGNTCKIIDGTLIFHLEGKLIFNH
jgi:hypothetical protein